MPRFIPGLPYLLTSLQAANIPIALIADAHSGNLEFSIRHFHLTEWFSMNHMVCSNRTLKGKPSPQLYLKAAEKLGKSPSSCLIVESTAFGVQAAADAGAGEIDVITENRADYRIFQEMPHVDGVYKNCASLFRSETVNNTFVMTPRVCMV